MKKYFITSLIFLAISSFASAKTDKGRKPVAIEKRVKKTKKTVPSAAAKKAPAKKIAPAKHTPKHHHDEHSLSVTHARKTSRTKQIKKGTSHFSKKEAAIMVKTNEYYAKLSPEELRMGDDFESSRGQLPWPVEGSVSLPFGVYTIEGTKIRGDNPGIMFSTDDNAEPVKAVFDGVVSDVNTKGEITSICIRHGKYSTVYGNLSAINVNKGDVVKKNQVIARIGNGYNSDGGELTFLVMVNHDNVNPALWLNRN